MNLTHIAFKRLDNQQFKGTHFDTPADLVGWMGAVQAQDYGAAKWALGLRMPASNDALMEQAFNEGRILRTHVMRPTWHFVTPADIRWMLELTAPRVNTLAAYYYRQVELDEVVFQKAKKVLIKALEGGHQLIREELVSALVQSGIVNNDLRMTHIMMWSELDGLICSGARRGKQHTYALLDERAPQAKSLPREEALVELARRYFISHGPATIQDFVWWSGLLMVDAKAGVDALKSELSCEVINGQTYWFA
ncbi:MAG: winged helix DNA-binding domain-containing protein, partial [Chloroflexota bacterium]